MKKQIAKQQIVIVSVVALSLMGCSKKDDSEVDARTIQQIQAEQGVPVTTQAVTQGSIRHLEQSNGTLEGVQQTVLANGVGGTLGKIHVSVGQKVRKGTRVASMIMDGGSPVVVAQANYDYAQKLYERVQKLHKEGAISQEQVEGAKTQYEAAKNQLGQAKTVISITTPFSGTVLEVFQKKGSKIKEKTPIVKVADLNKIKVQMHVSDQVINLYKAGQPSFLIMNSDTLWGKIERTALSANEMNHAYRVNAIFDNSDGLMKSGMFRNIYTVVKQKDEILKVPFEIVMFEGEKSFIYVAEGDKAVKREVVLGVRNGTEYEVVEGISAEDMIIVTGTTMISDGSKINVISE